jgi:acyl-CoA thioester hydrolase
VDSLQEFIWPIRVYYEDTDSGGVVYHSNYLNFMERARTEWLRSINLQQDDISKEYGIVFVVHSLAINYLQPALFNEALVVKSHVQKLARASIVFEQQIIRLDDHNNEQILTKGTVKVVSFGLEQKKPVSLPQSVYQLFVDGS